ncbi:MAG TPA: hypothetical protein VIK78_05925 [Ruminiclostridium sp.]
MLKNVEQMRAKIINPSLHQMQQHMGSIIGTEWEMMVMLGGMYGLRISGVLGLHWDHVDMEKTFQTKSCQNSNKNETDKSLLATL